MFGYFYTLTLKEISSFPQMYDYLERKKKNGGMLYSGWCILTSTLGLSYWLDHTSESLQFLCFICIACIWIIGLIPMAPINKKTISLLSGVLFFIVFVCSQILILNINLSVFASTWSLFLMLCGTELILMYRNKNFFNTIEERGVIILFVTWVVMAIYLSLTC